ncbi:hypothetical protein D046_5634A, partial [Vibrio parahaemolyticus V-223/04]
MSLKTNGFHGRYHLEVVWICYQAHYSVFM